MSNSKYRIINSHLCFPYRTQHSGLHELASWRPFECMYAWTLPMMQKSHKWGFSPATLCLLLYALWSTPPSFSEPTVTAVFFLHTRVSSLPWALLTAVQSKLGRPSLKVTPADPGPTAPLSSFLHSITWYLWGHYNRDVTCLSQSPFIPEPRMERFHLRLVKK